jgi:hypothetical protein
MSPLVPMLVENAGRGERAFESCSRPLEEYGIIDRVISEQ